MQEQINNPETSEESMRIEDKPIKPTNLKERMNGIAFLLRKVEFTMFMDDDKLSYILMVEKEDINRIHYLRDSEISTDMLFRLHYAAVLFSEKSYLAKSERKKMNALKKACYDEISKRNNWV